MDDLQITIRNGTPADAALLADLGRAAFRQAFGADNRPENLEAYLQGAFQPEIQLRELMHPGSSFKIAYSRTAIGYARLQNGSREPSVQAENPIELVRLYVLQAWKGQGVGGMLMKACIRAARELGHDALWLGVWQNNPAAIGFYKHYGFQIVGTHIFQLGDDPQQDYVMRLPLL